MVLFSGQENAKDLSDPNAVFEVFDDFDGNALDTSIWSTIEQGGKVTVSDGTLELRMTEKMGGARVETFRKFDPEKGRAIECRMRGLALYRGGVHISAESPFTSIFPVHGSELGFHGFGFCFDGPRSVPVQPEAWYRVGCATGEREARAIVIGEDGREVFRHAANIATTPRRVRLAAWQDGPADPHFSTYEVDWYAERPYRSPEPRALMNDEEGVAARAALVDWCRALMNSNEFIYVD